MSVADAGTPGPAPHDRSGRIADGLVATNATASLIPRLSVVICAHNPHVGRFERTLEGLRKQQLPADRWQLVVVDNRSDVPIRDRFDFAWHPNVAHVREDRLGLAHARVAGTEASTEDWCVTVDDDTVLDPDYLAHAAEIIHRHPDLGIFGGRSRGEFEEDPPAWVSRYHKILCVKDLGERPIVTRHETGRDKSFPANGPFLIAYRRDAFLEAYASHFRASEASQRLGRRGNNLASAEDNEITLLIYASGLAVGYFPQLWFTHLIPKQRVSVEYLARLMYSSNKSWTAFCRQHSLIDQGRITRAGALVRKARAFARSRAWRGGPDYIDWRASCGAFDGRVEAV